ncbi:hypothetical protein HMPREF9163_01673 [Selenomonas sp. oral taxon 138 str. F0429]|nr:hypothetical protein HMPREF9163_01673 [Selenomonas sp. oral taxon 138 str. F0429]
MIPPLRCDSKALCRANSTQTPRYASGRALICLNTCGLLKRASLERKKSAGGRTFPRFRLLH